MRLKLLGVAKVIVEFAGSGDSGSIDLIRATTADGAVVGLDEDSQPLLKWVSYSSAYDHARARFVETRDELYLSLEDVIRQVTETTLDQSDLDWYNNDGGQGCFSIDLTKSPPEIALEIGINHLETTDYSFTVTKSGSLVLGDEDEDEDEDEDNDAPTPP